MKDKHEDGVLKRDFDKWFENSGLPEDQRIICWVAFGNGAASGLNIAANLEEEDFGPGPDGFFFDDRGCLLSHCCIVCGNDLDEGDDLGEEEESTDGFRCSICLGEEP